MVAVQALRTGAASIVCRNAPTVIAAQSLGVLDTKIVQLTAMAFAEADNREKRDRGSRDSVMENDFWIWICRF